MSYKITAIDVHKKVLMVVVMDASTLESTPHVTRLGKGCRQLIRNGVRWL
jgi:hypothetical protein